MLTVHLLNGLESLKAANAAASGNKCKMLGVSVLTSFGDEDLELLGFKDQVENK